MNLMRRRYLVYCRLIFFHCAIFLCVIDEKKAKLNDMYNARGIRKNRYQRIVMAATHS